MEESRREREERRGMAGLAAQLAELKQRSGLSYAQLGKKAHLSRSTVHRYCTGSAVPAVFGPIEAIANACGADRAELARLYRLWERADLRRAGVQDPPSPEEADPAPAPPPVRPTAVRSALLGVLVVLLLVGGSTVAPPGESNTPLRAPMWTTAPRALEPEFVGVTASSNTGQMPSFDVGSVRLWNSRTRWQNVEPARGRYDWRTLDRLVDGARGKGLPVVFTFGGTPAWASPNGRKLPYADDSRAAPPDDLADWERFARTVAERYRGRIGAYELWDMANHPNLFTGSMAELAEMTRLASRAIRAADPAATVVCPSMGELWDPAALAELREFAELGGYDHCDAAAVKLAARNDADPPETMLALAQEIDDALHAGGAGIVLWSTGSAYDVGQQRPVDADRGAQHAVRFYLSGLYAGYRRMYFYNWGSAKLPLVLQPVGGPPTKAATHVARLHQWLTGSRIHSCGQGSAAGLPEGLWQCRFDRAGRTFLIWWTVDQGLRVSTPAGTTAVEDLDGGVTPAGAEVAVSGSPILLRIG